MDFIVTCPEYMRKLNKGARKRSIKAQNLYFPIRLANFAV